MNDNLFTEDWAVVGMVDPDANTAATYLTAAIDMTDWEQLAVITMVGTLGAAATVVTTVTASATSGGSYATVTGKTTSHALNSPESGSDTQKIINVRSSEVTSNKRFVKVSCVVGTATTDCAVIVLGKGRHRPAYDNDASSVSEIVN